MDKRRTFALVFSSAIYAFVLSHPAMTPRYGAAMRPLPVMAANTAFSAAPAGDEPMMVALRLEANAALARLQAEEPETK